LPLPALVNIPLFANAFFAPPTDATTAYMAFGDELDPPAFEDFARDPTVPRHEFGHAMVFDTGSAINDVFDCVGGCSSYPAAMHEALADYFAIASLGAHDTVVGAHLGTELSGVARDLNNDLRFPCDLSFDPHASGSIWAGFLLEVRHLLGPRADGL